MIQWASKYFAGISQTFLDGTLYFFIAIFGFLQTAFGSDEASKYIDLEMLFYIKTFVGSCSAGLLAIKLFRSTSYADHKADKKQKEETSFLIKTPTNQ